jgi:diguanylate cyclase (GGDEF)-like protein/PAS domain S-box-containing protein
LPAAARLFVAIVVAAGVASAVALAPHSIPDVPLFLTLLLASTLTSGITLRLPVGTANLSVAYIFDLTALLVFGTELAVLVAAASACSQSILGGRPQPLHRTIFNTATLALSMAAAGTAFTALGGHPGTIELRTLARPLIGCALAYHLCNTWLVATAVALTSGDRPRVVWQRDLLWTAPGYFVGAGVAAMGAALWQSAYSWLLPLVVAPAYLVFRSYRISLERVAAETRHKEEVERLHADTLAALAAAQRSEQRYALAAESSKDGLWDWDMQADTLYCSDRWKAMLGVTETEATSLQAWVEFIVPDDRAGFRRALDAHLRGETPHFEHEYRVLHRNGGVRSMFCRGTAVREQGHTVRMAGSQTDITESRRVQDTLSHAARHDSLTGLPNRMLFSELLQKAIGQYQRSPEVQYAVLFVDLDGFKLVNDSLGHLLGDQFLFAIAQRLQTALRSGDVLARLGGDEFAVLVRNLGPNEDVRRVTERLRDAVSSPFTLQGHQLYASASIGIVTAGPSYHSVDQVLRDADTAMYRAKSTGRGGYEIFDQSMHETAMKRLTLETKMRQAVERREFVVHYQPVVSIQTAEVTGVEALVRWRDAEGRLVAPGDFISAAEDTGLIVPITYLVLHEACRQVAEWQDRFARPLDVSVNISTQLLSRQEFVDQVADASTSHGLRPGSLRIEVTESALLNSSDIVDDNFARLRELPISIYLDDFGTGYSSLGFLQRYPVDVLKLDKSFVARMGKPGEDCRIGNAIITLARELGMGVIAEGVETAEQAAYLEQLGCPHAQGYLYSAPLTPDALAQFLVRQTNPALSAAS